MITAKERFSNTVNGKLNDRPPVICPGGMMNMITSELMEKIEIYLPEAHHDARKMANLAKGVYEFGCFENCGVPFCMTVEAEEMGAPVDFGNKFVEPHVTEYYINSVDEWKNLREIDINNGRSKVVIDAIKILKSEIEDAPIIGNITGPISTASSMMEPVDFYKELRKKKEKSHEMMNFITNQLMKFAIAQIEAGADIIAISDPSGTGEILGPRFFEEYVVEYINRIVDAARDRGCYTIVHICGQMNKVYNQIAKIRADILSFDSVVSISEAKKNLKGRLIMGNISTYALEFADSKKIAKLTNFCRKNGSDIISPACGLGMRTPLKNIQEIIKSLEEGI